VTVHKELGGDDVQAFADVFSDTHHLLCAISCGAQGALGLVVVFHAHQVLWQRLSFGMALGLNLRQCRRDRLVLQRIELGLQARLISGHSLFEQLALLGVHGFGAGGELPRLQPGQLEGDALDLGVFEFDGAVALGDDLIARGDLLALRSDVRKHLCGHFGQRRRAQTVQILCAELGFEAWGCEWVRLPHVLIVQSQQRRGYPGRNGLRALCHSRRNCGLAGR